MDSALNEDDCSFYEAVKRWDFKLIDKFTNNGADINASLVQSGPETGYTALHFACWQGMRDNVWDVDDSENYISRLIRNYGANANVEGGDGARPLHLACLLGYISAVNTLVDAGADVDAEFTKELCEKYDKNARWSDDFGGKLTPLAFAVINGNLRLVKLLLKNKANFAIKSINNKTLLMYAADKGYDKMTEEIAKYLHNRPEVINAYDNDGFHVAHYFLPHHVFGEFRYYENISLAPKKFMTLRALMSAGMDINATVNGDPDTLLLNTVALRGCYHMLLELFDLRIPLNSKSKALRNATLPVDSKKFMRKDDDVNVEDVMEQMIDTRERCIEFILKILFVRRTFELFVPPEEKKLMDHLIATDNKLKMFVRDFETKYIEEILKNYYIHCCNVHNDLSFFEILLKMLHRRPLQLCIGDELVEVLNQALYEVYDDDSEFDHLLYFMIEKIKITFIRKKLLAQVKNIQDLRKALPLPYELVLEIIDYMNNYQLRNFIDAFYENSSASSN